LRVGGDAGGVVIGGAGGESRAERVPIFFGELERLFADEYFLLFLYEDNALFQNLSGRFKHLFKFFFELFMRHVVYFLLRRRTPTKMYVRPRAFVQVIKKRAIYLHD
jgi:hypothetical protein